MTDANGFYHFTGLAPGTYAVQFVTPAGAYDKLTTANVGNDATDSDANTTTGKTGNYTLVSGQTDNTVDAGLLPIDLELTKSVNNTTPTVGSNVIFTVTVTNNNAAPGVSTATGVTVKDVLPDGLSFVSASFSDPTDTFAGNIWTVGTLAPGASATLSITATVTSGGTKTNFAQVQTADQTDTDSTPGNNTDNTPHEDDEAKVSLTPPAAIGDFVWVDSNGNGIQDAGEPGLANVQVLLFDCATNLQVGSTTTDARTACTSFTGLTPGSYHVQFIAPDGYVFTKQDEGGDDLTDSDADPATGATVCTTLDSGETDNTWDAGLYQPASIGDYVWEDANGNGVQDTGEPGIAGATAKLFKDGVDTGLTYTTLADGFYQFTGLAPGTYSVQFVLPGGYVFTGQDQGGNDATDSDANPTTGQTGTYTLVSGQYNDTVDAGAYQPVSVGNFVWNDSDTDGIQDSGELGINGVTLTLTGTDGTGTAITPRTTTTSGNGGYLFDGLPPGTYTVTIDASNFASGGVLYHWLASPTFQGSDTAQDSNPSPTGTTPAFLPSADSDLTLDFGYYLAQPSINIVKLTNGTNNNSPTGPVVPVGSTVTFTYIVTNTGNVPLSTLSVTDDKLGAITSFTGDTDNDGLLDVTETWTYTATTIATAGQYVNTGTVTGNPVDENGNDIPGLADQTDSDIDHHFGATAGVNIVKLTNGTDNNTPTGPVVPVGSTVTFTYIVTNTGNVPLSNVSVTDDKGVTPVYQSGDSDGDGLLDVSETWTYTASTTATAGQYTNTGTVTGNPVDEQGTDIPGPRRPDRQRHRPPLRRQP